MMSGQAQRGQVADMAKRLLAVGDAERVGVGRVFLEGWQGQSFTYKTIDFKIYPEITDLFAQNKQCLLHTSKQDDHLQPIQIR
jgi:hypothetical protein